MNPRARKSRTAPERWKKLPETEPCPDVPLREFLGSSTPGSTRFSATLRSAPSLPFQNQKIETGLFEIAVILPCRYAPTSPSHHRLVICTSGRRMGSTSEPSEAVRVGDVEKECATTPKRLELASGTKLESESEACG